MRLVQEWLTFTSTLLPHHRYFYLLQVSRGYMGPDVANRVGLSNQQLKHDKFDQCQDLSKFQTSPDRFRLFNTCICDEISNVPTCARNMTCTNAKIGRASNRERFQRKHNDIHQIR